MTAKRFTYIEQFNGFCDVHDNGKILSCMRLEYVEKTVNLLNNLYEENERLKYSLSAYMIDLNNYKSKCNALEKENNQLKEKNKFLGLLANHRGEMVGFANSLIYDDGSDEMQEMWKSLKDKMFTEWKKKRGIE